MKWVFTLLFVLGAPTLALAAPTTFKELIDLLVTIMNLAVPMLITVALVFYFFGIAANVLEFGDEKARLEKMKSYMFYGILILFVMVSIWGILNLLDATFLSAGNGGESFGTDDQQVQFDCALGACLDE